MKFKMGCFICSWGVKVCNRWNASVPDRMIAGDLSSFIIKATLKELLAPSTSSPTIPIGDGYMDGATAASPIMEGQGWLLKDKRFG